MPSYYVPSLKKDTTFIELDKKESHHILNVMRKDKGHKIRINNGRGLIADSFIKESSNNRNVILEITRIRVISKSFPRIATAFSLLKNKNDLVIIEKLSELGVSEFFPVLTDYTVKKGSSNTIDKYKKTAIAAIKQCDNAYLPIINEVENLENCLIKITNTGYLPIVALETEKSFNLFSVLESSLLLSNYSGICFIVGPEGGFSNSEKNLFKNENIKTFTLGNHILRAETAAIATAANISGYLLSKDNNYY